MKVIEAHWEKRNLGLGVIEITLGESDLKSISQTVKAIVDTANDRYVVVKTPAGSLELIHALQRENFYFMEDIYTLGIDLDAYELPKKYTTLSQNYYAVVKDSTKIQTILSRLEGNLYTTDRVYLDPKLDSSISEVRYRNWMLDLVKEDNTLLYEIVCSRTEEAVGFGLCILDKDKLEINSLLTGIYREFQGCGLSGLVIHSPITIAQNLGFKSYRTSISSNNVKVVKTHWAFEMKLVEKFYTLRRFPDRGTL